MSAAKERVKEGCCYVWTSFSRTKTLDVAHLQDTQLKRCLNMIDLTALGVGSTLGAGVYVITSEVAKNQAGPAIVLSFLIAAVASLLAALCYAEFASRVPRAGSAYVYSYVSIGEFWAFVIGWNMILENVIGAASVGKAWSEYFDSMLNDTIKRHIQDGVGMLHTPGLAEYPDLLAFTLLLAITLLVSLGVKMSSVVNFVFTVLNVLVILCILAIGVFHVDRRNWTQGEGFFPYGFRGVVSGAATCFYAFVGFDTIATSGEEAMNPSRNIPTAIVSTLLICFLAYFGVSAILTLMVPYNMLADSAGLPKAFTQCGVVGAEYIIGIGGMCGLTSSMMGCIFPLPRTIYSMAQDGLIFRFLGHVSSYTNTPALATWVCGMLAAVMALLFDLDSLVQMMSIGTLMAYTLVSASVLLLRYRKDHIGYSAADLYADLGVAREGSEHSVKSADGASATATTSPPTEDTGLIKVGDQVKAVKYAPSQETTVYKRTGSITEDTVTNGRPRRLSRDIVEEATRKRDKEILERMASHMSQESVPPADSTYRRMDSNYSLNSLSRLFHLGDENSDEPTERSRQMATLSIAVIVLFWTLLCVLSVLGEQYVFSGTWWAVSLLVLFAFIVICFTVALIRQPQNRTKAGFSVPFVPLLPLLSTMVNIYLMLTLSYATWMRFFVWMALGFLIYFGYGMQHSSERRADDQELILYDVGDRDSIVSVGPSNR